MPRRNHNVRGHHSKGRGRKRRPLPPIELELRPRQTIVDGVDEPNDDTWTTL